MTAIKALAIIGLSALLAAPSAGLSQTTGRVLRVALLDDASEKARADSWHVFRARLRELGYSEGKNLIIETRYAGGSVERLPALAAELVALKPEVIVVPATPATRAVMKATSSIPIVFIGIGDPVALGVVASLARPGGNATGTSIISTELGAKWVEILREIAPTAKRVAYIADTSSEGSLLAFKRVEEHARTLNVTVQLFGGRQRQQLERSLEAVAQGRFAGLIVHSSAVLLAHREQIVQFAAQQKLPAVYGRRDYADAGGLLSYSVDIGIMYRRSADYVDRIAKGAKPAELPVERPDTVRMVLNLKTARAQGINIPPSIRHRADELID